MSKAVKVLLVEDSEDDARLAVRMLQRGGFEVQYERVESVAAMEAALQRQAWDAVISDYRMPGFTGLDALKLLRSTGQDIPFILISGAIGEALAVEAMKAGASDYLMKTNLARLEPALKRELNEAAIRTANRQMQRALQASEAWYRTIFDKSPVAITHLDLGGHLLLVNPKFTELMGYVQSEIAGRRIRDLTHPDDVAAGVRIRERLLTGEITSFARELRLVRKDQMQIWVNVTGSLVRTADGHPDYFISVFDDITERKRTEADLQRFRAAVDVSADAIMVTERSSMRYAMVNEAASRMLGYSGEELLAMGPHDLLQVSREQLERTYDELIGGSQSAGTYESTNRRKDGSLVPVEVFRRALPTDSGYLVVASVRDITERKRAEQAQYEYVGRLRQLSHRLFEVQESERRRLARELHDRIGQNVTSLSLNLGMVRGALPAGVLQKVSTRLDDCASLLDSTAQLVRDVMVDLRPSALDDLGLVAALNEHAREVASRAGIPVTVIGAEVAPRLPPATEITLFRIAQEALVNVIKHARATEATVTLEADADAAVLTVADNGRGFDTTLAEPARSLGMVSMRERAESIGARLSVESAPDQGTRVIVHASRSAPADTG